MGALALIILSPLLLIISLAVLFTDGAPVIFKQARVGKNDSLFYIYKFRTMKTGTRNVAKKDLDEYKSCITPVGRILRKTSLDELPQLLNIIKGEMSFVGPRPLIPEEAHIRELRREYGVYSVLPGVTGWAQVKGRDNFSDEEKAGYDREYVERQSLAFDIKIVFMTVGVVLTHKNMSPHDDV
ncbi:MAG: sugar transferase [Clostridiales bacterium]|nr:sugar transferase [Clostridiales bacterium]